MSYFVVPAVSAVPTFTDVMSRLTVASSGLQRSFHYHSALLVQTKKDLAGIEAGKEELAKELERSGRRYNYYQEIRNFVADLGEFLDAKVSL